VQTSHRPFGLFTKTQQGGIMGGTLM
jgi:hypothetical protein